MTTVDTEVRDAMDPATSPARLAEVLSIRPDLAAVVAQHPNAYPELLSWIAQHAPAPAVSSGAAPAAWAALQDPATDASALAAIAGSHPEFAEAIGRHPNAYPALIQWAQAQTAGQRWVAGAASVQPQSASESGASSLRRRNVVWLIAAILYLVVPNGFWIMNELAGGFTFDVSDEGFPRYPLWWVLLTAWPPLLFAAAAAFAAPSGTRRLCGALCGVGSAIVLFVRMSLIVGLFNGGVPSELSSMVLLAVYGAFEIGLAFLAWGVSRPLSGLGYTAIVLPILFEGIYTLGIYPAILGLVSEMVSAAPDPPYVVIDVVMSISDLMTYAIIIAATATATVAILLSRVSERRAVRIAGMRA